MQQPMSSVVFSGSKSDNGVYDGSKGRNRLQVEAITSPLPTREKGLTNPILLEARCQNCRKKQTNMLGTFHMFQQGKRGARVLQDPKLLPCWPSVVVHPSLPFSQTRSPPDRNNMAPWTDGICQSLKWVTNAWKEQVASINWLHPSNLLSQSLGVSFSSDER